MATQLFLLDTAPDTHLGGTFLNLIGGASGNYPRALGTSRGSGVVASGATPTVTGATPGVLARLAAAADYQWTSPPVAADVTISGTITANIWASESNMSANVAINVVIEIIRANDLSGTNSSNKLVEIVRSTNATEVAVTTRAANNFTTGMTSGGYSSQTLNRGDRLRIRVFGDDVGTMASGFTFDASFNGASAAADGDSYVTFTENITFESAPGTVVLEQASGVAGQSYGNSAGGSIEMIAQPFVAQGTTLTSVEAQVSNSGATDNMIVEVWSDSGGSPGSSLTTVATVAGASIPGGYIRLAWTTSLTVTSSTTYWLVFRRTTLAANSYGVRTSANGAPASGWGTLWKRIGGVWSSGGAAGDTTATVRFAFTDPSLATTMYLTDTASAVATASVDREAWTSRGNGVNNDVVNTTLGQPAPIQLTDTAGGTVVDWFTRPLTAFTLGGMAVANLRALESNIVANASLRCEVARVEGDGTSPTVWGSWCIAPSTTDYGELTTSEVARTANVSGDDLAITNGQRLRIRVYADNSGNGDMASAQTVTFYYDGTSAAASGDSYITFPQTLTEYSSGPFTYTKAGFGKESG